MARSVYAFRRMSIDDLPMIRGWLRMPHVAQWWGNPDQEFALISGDLNHPAMDQYIIAIDNRPFAYLQCYDPISWPDNGLDPSGTRGIDQFIGDPAMIDCGHGSAFTRVFVEHLLEKGTPRVLTDPDPRNTRAIRAYEKAGFAKLALIETPGGPALLMVRDT